MFFKDRQGTNLNRKKITIISQTPTEIIADIVRADSPTEEGTKVCADTFNTFQQEIDAANNNANIAETNSAHAVSVAQEANTFASDAKKIVENALEIANDASSVSDSAALTASSAKSVAEGAEAKASEALSNSEDSVSIASDASEKADNAVAVANRALENSDSAVASSNSAVDTANSALSTSENASLTANSALSKADEAIAKSNEASATALRIEQVVAIRGATVNINGVPQTVVDFDSDPQSQLNQKINSDIETIKNVIMSVAYPVGSIYMSMNSTNPQLLFGGEWEKLEGRFLLGANANYAVGATGGEVSHTLTLSEIPSHVHNLLGRNTNMREGVQAAVCKSWDGSGGMLETYAAGGGGAHNNMPPYLAVYMWKRIR